MKKKRISFSGLDTDAETLPQEDSPDETEIEYTVAGIKKAIMDLPDGYRAVLTLYLLEGYDQEEIAEILHISHSTVRTQYTRGKKKLLLLLKKEN